MQLTTKQESRNTTKDAIQRVGDNAAALWKQRAEQAVMDTALVLAEFDVNDVWLRLIEAHGSDYAAEGTHNMRAMGAVMVLAARRGVCANSGRYHKRDFLLGKQTHVAHVTIWHSLVFGTSAPQPVVLTAPSTKCLRCGGDRWVTAGDWCMPCRLDTIALVEEVFKKPEGKL